MLKFLFSHYKLFTVFKGVQRYGCSLMGLELLYIYLQLFFFLLRECCVQLDVS